jgi:hypothetical protein
MKKKTGSIRTPLRIEVPMNSSDRFRSSGGPSTAQLLIRQQQAEDQQTKLTIAPTSIERRPPSGTL